ncbi:MAG: response regulator [bacterium]
MIKLLIAEDYAILREGLKLILGQTSDIVVADEASSGQEALDKVREKNYDMVLLGISMIDGSGLDILKQIKVERPQLPVIVLSTYPEERFALRALRASASGFLTKESTSDEMLMAIRKVALGGRYISTSLAEKIAFHLEPIENRPPHEALSDREYEVMCMIALGKSLKEISEKMSLSVQTIRGYRTRIFNKMGFKNSSEISYYALKDGLIE